MRSVLKNKRAFEMGFVEIMYLILGALVIFFIVTSVFGVDWGAIVKGWLPRFNTTVNNSYSDISGYDEEILVQGVQSTVSNELLATKQGVSYSRLAADVCTLFGYGGLFANVLGTTDDANGIYHSAFSGQDFSQSGIGEIESIQLADEVSGAVVVDAAGKVIGNILKNPAGEYILSSASTSGSLTVKITSSGQIVEPITGQVWGSLSKGQRVNVLLKGGTKISSSLGDDAIITMSKTKVPFLVSSSSKAFSFLSKVATVAGYATAGVSAVCDLSATFMSAYYAEEAALEFLSSQKAADDQLGSLIKDVDTRTHQFFELTNDLYSQNPELRETSPEFLEAVKVLVANSTSIQTTYYTYLSNGDAMPAPFWRKLLFLKSSQITNEEYSNLMKMVREYRVQYQKVQEIYEEDFSEDFYSLDDKTEQNSGSLIIIS